VIPTYAMQCFGILMTMCNDFKSSLSSSTGVECGEGRDIIGGWDNICDPK